MLLLAKLRFPKACREVQCRYTWVKEVARKGAIIPQLTWLFCKNSRIFKRTIWQNISWQNVYFQFCAGSSFVIKNIVCVCLCLCVGFPLLLLQILISYDGIRLSYTKCVHTISSLSKTKSVQMMENIITSTMNHIDVDWWPPFNFHPLPLLYQTS